MLVGIGIGIIIGLLLGIAPAYSIANKYNKTRRLDEWNMEHR